jgi:hypothetical protein
MSASPKRQEWRIKWAAAIAKGEMTFVGGPCEYGHGGERYTSTGECACCRRISQRRYYHTKKGRALEAVVE